jgi:hypothetical protein
MAGPASRPDDAALKLAAAPAHAAGELRAGEPARVSLGGWRSLRFVPLAAGAVALVWGLRAGLVRLGWDLPGGADPALHGPLMICGFFGTLISLERAVAAGRAWAYAAPATSAAGAIALLTGYEAEAHAAFLAAGMLLAAVSVRLCLRMPALFTVLIAVAAAAWSVGTALWAAGAPMAAASGWWLAFLVLTIAAERIELSRLVQPPWWSGALLAAGAGLILLGAARGELASGSAHATGAGFLVTTLWLLRFDVARFTVRQRGQVRFSALSLLAGYFWLGAAGVVLLRDPGSWIHGYDAAVHAVAIGFVLSMVFAHAPIILPAITGARVAYTALLYAPLAVLHLSVTVRIAGDLLDVLAARQAAGVLTLLALLGYAATLAGASLRHRRRRA